MLKKAFYIIFANTKMHIYAEKWYRYKVQMETTCNIFLGYHTMMVASVKRCDHVTFVSFPNV